MHSDCPFGSSGKTVSAIGLGCSRLGSVLGASRESSVDLIRAALDAGISFFDTSDIYAQGDSERILGEVIGRRDDVMICTKAGKHLSPLKQALLPLKSVLRKIASCNSSVAQGVRQSRAKPMPTTWTPSYILGAVDHSLRRLGRERIDVLMLHSPPVDEIRKGDALGALILAQEAGKIGIIGISVDDPESALAAMEYPQVGALQIPLHPGDTVFDAALERAAAQGVAVVAREVLGGPNAIDKEMLLRDAVQARLREVTARPEVSLALVGTTKVPHLMDAVEAFGV